MVVVLSWQVSEVYKLHRETYHLAQDYFDRFLATQRNVFKSMLQLIGITCLFIAAKVEVRSSAPPSPPPSVKGSFWCRWVFTLLLCSPPLGDVSTKGPPVRLRHR